MAELLEIQGVSKEYGTTVVTRALRGIDLTVRAGEFVALTGPSGSGRSTLLNLVGLLDRPTNGRIVLGGTDTGSLEPDGLARFRGRSIGFVFQFHHLLPEFTALENVMMPGFADAGRISPEMIRNGEELLAEVGLADRAGYKPGEMSGGQQQRVAIARALAMSPAMVLADEPTGNLDQESGDQCFRLLRRLNAERNVTLVLVTHDDRLAARCDRNVHLVDGQIEFDRQIGDQGSP
jgi:lipoprotein-releasing system ATP-binding protein